MTVQSWPHYLPGYHGNADPEEMDLNRWLCPLPVIAFTTEDLVQETVDLTLVAGLPGESAPRTEVQDS